MAEYIEREALKENMRKRLLNGSILAWLCGIINEQPAADVVPVVHARWLNKEVDDLRCHVYGNCSVCHERKRIDNYCPNCGAIMDLKENDHGDKVPLEQVLDDMYDPYSAVSGAARDYYYREYATEEERKAMDREDRINTIIAACLLGFVVVCAVVGLFF